MRGEIAWLRQGAKARTTKQQARIAKAGALIDELTAAQDRIETPTAGIAFTASGRQTRRLVVATGLGKDRGGRTLIDDLDLVLRPGMRLGLLGANGSGKSTLLQMLAGTLAPDRGTLTRADDLRSIHFDQQRGGLDPSWPLRRALAGEADTVIYQGRPIHIASWAKRFLFRFEQLGMPIGQLSGGERARVHIARLMLEPADLMLLDEPTNDLDIPTLEVLEESLLEFTGAIVLVTHDRFLLDRVTTSLLALDGRGGVEAFADLAQWQAAQSARRAGRAWRSPRGGSGDAYAPIVEASRLPRAARMGLHGGDHRRRRRRRLPPAAPGWKIPRSSPTRRSGEALCRHRSSTRARRDACTRAGPSSTPSRAEARLPAAPTARTSSAQVRMRAAAISAKRPPVMLSVCSRRAANRHPADVRTYWSW